MVRKRPLLRRLRVSKITDWLPKSTRSAVRFNASEIRQPVLKSVRQKARRKASGSSRTARSKARRSAPFKYFRLPFRSNMAAPFLPCEPECVILVHGKKLKTLHFLIMKTQKNIHCFVVVVMLLSAFLAFTSSGQNLSITNGLSLWLAANNGVTTNAG